MEDSPIVFLDRDGTINIDTEYIKDPEGLQLIEGAGAALGELKRNNYQLVIVSNQSGIGRGMMTEADVEAVNSRLVSLLEAEDSDAVPDKILYCPHSPDQGCECRKPKAGLIDFKFNADLAYVIGDKRSDLDLGKSLAIPEKQRILVLTGNGKNELQSIQSSGRTEPVIFASLVEASQHILKEG